MDFSIPRGAVNLAVRLLDHDLAARHFGEESIRTLYTVVEPVSNQMQT